MEGFIKTKEETNLFFKACLLGATYILMPSFETIPFIEIIKREKVTHIMVVPSQIIAILNAPNFSYENLKSLEMILSLGAPLLRKHKDALQKVLPNRFYELYGLTEGNIFLIYNT